VQLNIQVSNSLLFSIELISDLPALTILPCVSQFFTFLLLLQYKQSVYVLANLFNSWQLLHSAVEHVEKKARGQHGTLTICCKNFDLVKLKFNSIDEALNVASSIEVLSTVGRI